MFDEDLDEFGEFGPDVFQFPSRGLRAAPGPDGPGNQQRD
jgi:hypothetical protein